MNWDDKAEWHSVQGYDEESEEHIPCPECGHFWGEHAGATCPAATPQFTPQQLAEMEELKKFIPRADTYVKKIDPEAPPVKPVTAAPPPAAPVAPPPKPLDLGCTIWPTLSRDNGRGGVMMDKWLVVMVGAGGVGARLAPLLVKHLTVGDKMFIVDGDTVEAKNINRQHFVPQDIGLGKAQVVAMRAKATAPREGTEVGFLNTFLDEKSLPLFCAALCTDTNTTESLELFGERQGFSVLLITCVDTLKARKDLRVHLQAAWKRRRPNNLIWVDCGNGMAHGQAMVMALGCGFYTPFNMAITGEKVRPINFANQLVEPWNDILPGFLDREDAPAQTAAGGDNCAVRIDEQTVLANAWAALAAATVSIPIITLSGIRTMGVGFSVAGSATLAACSQEVLQAATKGYPPGKWVSKRLA